MVHIVGVNQPVIPLLEERCACPPLRLGCATAATGPLPTARTTVRTTARTASGPTPISALLSSGWPRIKKQESPSQKPHLLPGLFLFQTIGFHTVLEKTPKRAFFIYLLIVILCGDSFVMILHHHPMQQDAFRQNQMESVCALIPHL